MPQVEVIFDIDANGILSVTAKDKATGKSQNIRIEASSGLSKDEIDKMKKEAEANADADKKAREEVDKVNAADSLIFQTEKQLKEYGDKIPADKKGNIETAFAELKTAHGAKDLAGIEVAMTKLNSAWQAASEDMYKASQGGQAANGADANAGNGAAPEGDGKANSDVADVEYEEVKDDKK